MKFRINAIKDEELEMDKRPKPITFTITKGREEKSKGRIKKYKDTVKFEMEGGTNFKTSFVRQNEQEFYEFITNFNSILHS